MAETLGEGLALQSSFKPTTEPILTKSLLRADEMDMKKALQKQKQEEARLKREKDIYGRIKTFDAKLNPYYQSKAKQDYANYINQSLEAARQGDQDALVGLNQDFTMRSQAYKQQSDAMDNFVKLSQQGFLVPQEIARIRELPHEQADAELKKLLQERPEFSTIVNVGDNGEIMFNPIKNVDVNKYLTDVLENNKELATEVVGSKMLSKNTKELVRRIPKDKIDLIAQDLALDPNVQGNLIFKDRKAYDAIYDKIEAANPNINPQDAKLMAMKELVQTKLEGLNKRTERANVPTGKGGLNINLGGGTVTPNKWGLFPSTTVHGENMEQYEARNKAQLAELNALRRSKGQKELTYDEAYPKRNTQYDEVVLENQDVSENKTFQYPDGKGGLIDVTPVSIRRKKGTNDWVLVGKKKQKIGDKTTYVDVELPYSAAVRQKTDAILGANTGEYLAQQFGVNKPKQSQTNTQPKLTFPQWKQKNPNGSASEYKKYLGK